MKWLLPFVFLFSLADTLNASSGLTFDETFVIDQELFNATFVEDDGNVVVMNFSGNFDKDASPGTYNAAARAVVAKEFYRTHQDIYDFLVIFTEFEYDTSPYLAFEYTVKNNIQGIGFNAFDVSSYFGSDGELDAIIDMAATSRYTLSPGDKDYETPLMFLAHETFHRWGARVQYKDEFGNLSDGLLGSENTHWSFLLDSGASVAYGNKWLDNGDGTFTSVDVRQFYSPLDLYLMGLYSADEVPSMLLIDSNDVSKEALPRKGAKVSGTATQVTIDQIIEAEGERVPSAANSQKQFRFAFIFLKDEASPVDRETTGLLNMFTTNWSQRFSALTGGRAVALVNIQNKSELSTGSQTYISGSTLSGNGVNKVAATEWLASLQNAEGYWLDRELTALRDTAGVLQAFSSGAVGSLELNAARDWLRTQSPEQLNTDSLARMILALYPYENVNSLLDVLESRQGFAGSFNGGWGLNSYYQASPIDTALAIQALVATGRASADELEISIQYLLLSQNLDGGWGAVESGFSNLTTTLEVLKALKLLGVLDSVKSSALAFVQSYQQQDGGFGLTGSSAHDTANVISTLNFIESLNDIDVSAAASYLYNHQGIDGDWEGSVYTTALVLSALQSVDFANLSLSALEVEKTNLTNGELTGIHFTVRNDSNSQTPATQIRFYLDELLEANKIGADVTVPSLAPYSSVQLDFYWLASGSAGTHDLLAVVDPDHQLEESTRLDNTQSSSITIKEAPNSVELSVSENDFELFPNEPLSLPVDLAVSVNVRNLGAVAATNALVNVWKGTPNSAQKVLIHSETIDVAALSNTLVNFSVNYDSPVATDFYVEVDADNQFIEDDESNNLVSKKVVPQASIDLAVSENDLVFSSPDHYLGVTSVLDLDLHNFGTRDASNVTVKVELHALAEVDVKVLFNEVINFSAVSTVHRVITWENIIPGDYELVVSLDPTNQLSEIDESNNTLTVPITVQTQQGINLRTNFADISVNPDPLFEGQGAVVSTVVTNTGTVTANNVLVNFYDGEPSLGGELIDSVIVAELLAGESKSVSANWLSVNGSGQKIILVELDSNNSIVEFNETDNSAFILVDVDGIPDLTVVGNSILLTPSAPALGETFLVTPTIRNLAGQQALDIEVALYANSVTQENLVATQTIPQLLGYQSVEVEFAYTAQDQPNILSLIVVVDPNQLINEANETNNSQTRLVEFQGSSIYATNLYISPNNDGVQDDTIISFQLETISTVSVAIFNEKSQQVRTFTNDRFGNALKNIIAGSVFWAGKDDAGSVLDDGKYTVKVLNGSGSALRSLDIVIDNNRATLFGSAGATFAQAIESGDIELADLVCYNDAVYNDDWSTFWLSPDGSYFYFVRDSKLYKADFSSAPRQLIFDLSGFEVIEDISFSPDEMHLVFWSSSSLYNSDGLGLVNLNTGEEQFLPADMYSSLSWDNWERPRAVFINNQYAVIPYQNYQGFGLMELNLLDVNSGELFDIYQRANEIHGTPLLYEPQFWYDEFGGVIKSPTEQKAVAYLTNGPQGQATVIHLIDLVDAQSPRVTPLVQSDDYRFGINLGDDGLVVKWSPDGNFIAVGIPGGWEWNDPNEYEQGIPKLKIFSRNGTLLYEPDLSKEPWPLYEIGEVVSLPDIAWSPDSSELLIALSDDYITPNECSLVAYNLASGAIRSSAPFEQCTTYFSGGSWSDNQKLYWEDNDEAIMISKRDGLISTIDVRSNPITADLVEIPFTYRADKIFYTQNSLVIYGNTTADFPSYSDGQCTETHTSLAGLASTANASVGIEAFQSVVEKGIVISGTASDENFSHFVLEYANSPAFDDWSVIITGTREVDNERITLWAPPAASEYALRLTVYDLAGNEKHAIKKVIYNQSPSLSHIKLDNEYISPNGDSLNDGVTFTFNVLVPGNYTLNVYNEQGQWISSVDYSTSVPVTGAQVSWNGTNSLGQTLPDGIYELDFNGYHYQISIDNTAPVITDFTPSLLDKLLLANPQNANENFEKVIVNNEYKATFFDLHLDTIGLQQFDTATNTWKWVGQETGKSALSYCNTLKNPSCEKQSVFDIDIHHEDFRWVATDAAGNTKVSDVSQGLKQNKLILASASDHRLETHFFDTLGDINVTNFPIQTTYYAVDGFNASLKDNFNVTHPDQLSNSNKLDVEGRSDELRVELLNTLIGQEITNITVEYRNRSINEFNWQTLAISQLVSVDTLSLENNCIDLIDSSVQGNYCFQSVANELSYEGIERVQSLVFATSGLIANNTYEIRLHVFAASGDNWLTNAFLYSRLEGDGASESSLEYKSAEISKDLKHAFVFTVSNSEAIARSLFIQSPDHLKYQSQTLLETVLSDNADRVATSLDSNEVETTVTEFNADLNINNCTTYNIVVEEYLQTDSNGGFSDVPDEFKIVHEPEKVETPCVEISTETKPVFNNEVCGVPTNQISLSATVSEALSIYSDLREEDELKYLSIGYVDKNRPSGMDVFFNVNEPGIGEEVTAILDTSEMVEGNVPIIFRAETFGGERIEQRINLPIDHTPVVIHSLSPTPNESVCASAIRPNSNSGEALALNYPALTGELKDVGIAIDYDFNDMFNAYNEERVRIVTGSLYGNDADNLGQVFEDAQTGNILKPVEPLLFNGVTTLFGYLGSQKVDESQTEVNLDFEARDWSTYRTCQSYTYQVDAQVKVSDISGLDVVFSPNGDGVKDQFEIGFELDESAYLSADLETLSGNSLGNVIDEIPLAIGAQTVAWDGTRTSNGQVVPDGNYRLRLVFSDECGNIAETKVPVEVDTFAPVLSITYPKNGDPISTVIDVVGSVQDKNIYTYEVAYAFENNLSARSVLAQKEGNVPTNALQTEGVLARWNTFGLPEGTNYRVYLSAVDRAGNKSEINEAIYLDVRSGLISAFGVNEEYVSPNFDGLLDTLIVNAEFEYSVLVTLGLYTDSGQAVYVPIEDVAVASGAHSFGLIDLFNYVPVNDGDYQVQMLVKFQDNPSLEETVSTTVVIDTKLPVADVENINNGFMGKESELYLTVFDENLKSYELSIFSYATSTSKVFARGTQNIANAFVGDLSPSSYPEGDYQYSISAGDFGENAFSQEVDFVIDRTDPGIVIDQDVNSPIAIGGETDFEIKGSISDLHFSHYEVRYFTSLDGNGQLLFSSENTVEAGIIFNWQTSGLSQGNHYLKINAYDLANNTSEKIISFMVDAEAPELSLSSPSQDSWLTGPTQIVGTVNDINLDYFTLSFSPHGQNNWSVLTLAREVLIDENLFFWKVLPIDGDYDLRLQAFDKFGASSEVVVEIGIDQTPPSSPTFLDVTLSEEQGLGTVLLTWEASIDGDVLGYNLYRAGQLISSGIDALFYKDVGVSQGKYEYKLTAVDKAGQESAYSSPVFVNVDFSPPVVSLVSPANNALVNASVEITGSANASPDFKEYRVSYARSDLPEQWHLIKTSSLGVTTGVLANWNTLGLDESTNYLLRLEAEDLQGNVADVSNLVTVDNTPPSAPTNFSYTQSGNEITLNWDANTEADISSYVIIRQATSGQGNFNKYEVANNSYIDVAPDGNFVYQVFAVDLIGNISEASILENVIVDISIPHVTFVKANYGSEAANVLVESADSDIAYVTLRYQVQGDFNWTDISSVYSAPFEWTWDMSDLAYGYYLISAVAVDSNGNVDNNPEQVNIVHQDVQPPAIPKALSVFSVNNSVTLNWNANTESDLFGYRVYKKLANQSNWQLLNFGPPVTNNTYTYSETGSGNFEYAVTALDQLSNESAFSESVSLLLFSPTINSPDFTGDSVITSIEVESPVSGIAVIEVENSGGVTVLTGESVSPGVPAFFEDVLLADGQNTVSAYISYENNVSQISTIDLIVSSSPSAPTGLAGLASAAGAGLWDVDLSWDSPLANENIIGYLITDTSGGELLNEQGLMIPQSYSGANWDSLFFAFDQMEGSLAIYNLPVSEAMPAQIDITFAQPRLISKIALTWGFFGAGTFKIEAFTGGQWESVVDVSGNNQTYNEFLLSSDNIYTDQLRLKITSGVDPFIPQIMLDEISVEGLEIEPNNFATLPAYLQDNETSGFQIQAMNAYGLISEYSDTVFVTGSNLAPNDLALVAEVNGSDVLLSWNASNMPSVTHYHLYREDALIAELPLSTSSYEDIGLTSGEYQYEVFAVELTAGDAQQVGSSSSVSVVIDQPAMSAPFGLTATYNQLNQEILLSWQDDNIGSINFEVWKSINDGSFEHVNQTTSFSWVDKNIGNAEFSYFVKAIDQNGNESPESEIVSISVTGIPSLLASPIFLSPGMNGETVSTNQTLVDISGIASENATVYLVDGGTVVDSQYISSLPIKGNEPFNQSNGFFENLFVSPDGHYLAQFKNSQIVIFDTETKSRLIALNAFGVVESINWSLSGEELIYVYRDTSLGIGRLGSINLSTGLRLIIPGQDNNFDVKDLLGVDGSGELLLSANVLSQALPSYSVFGPLFLIDGEPFVGTDLPIFVPDSLGEISDITIKVNITHTRTSDLILSLVSPSGVVVELSNGAGGSGDNYIDTQFNDNATQPIQFAQAPFTGVFKPNQPLSQLFAEDTQGLWSLNVKDSVFGEIGTIDNWTITFEVGGANGGDDPNNGIIAFNSGNGIYNQVLETPTSSLSADLSGMSSDGNYLAYVSLEDGYVRIVDTESKQTVWTSQTANSGSSEFYTKPVWNYENHKLFYSTFDGISYSFRIFDLDTDQVNILEDYASVTPVLASGWIDQENVGVMVNEGSGSLIYVYSTVLSRKTLWLEDVDNENYFTFVTSALNKTFVGTGNGIYDFLPIGSFLFKNVFVSPGENLFRAFSVDNFGYQGPINEGLTIVREVLAQPLPDLRLAKASDQIAFGVNTNASIELLVENVGQLSASGIYINAYVEAPDNTRTKLDSVFVTTNLSASNQTNVSLNWSTPDIAGEYKLVASVNSANEEITLANNTIVETLYVVDGETYELSIESLKDSITVGEIFDFDISFVNLASYFNGKIIVSVKDQDGYLVEMLPEIPLSGIEWGGTISENYQWDSAGIYPGNYVIDVQLIDANNQVKKQTQANFSLLAKLELTSTLSADKGKYAANQTVDIAARITNISNLSVVDNLELLVQVLDESGNMLEEFSSIIPGMPAESTVTQSYQFETGNVEPGAYQLSMSVNLNGETVLLTDTSFEIISTVTIELISSELLSQYINAGDQQAVGYEISNIGNQAIDEILLEAKVVNQQGSVISTSQQLEAFSSSGVSGSLTLETGALKIGEYRIQLFAVFQVGAQVYEKYLVEYAFSVIDSHVPEIEILAPVVGQELSYRGNVAVTIKSWDLQSQVALVEVKLDDGEWQTIRETQLHYYSKLLALSEPYAGSHVLYARATDSYGNVSEIVSSGFTVSDSLPPEIEITYPIDGGYYSSDVVPEYVLSPEEAVLTAVLNGSTYSLTSPINQEGEYDLQLVANNNGLLASDSVGFVVDKTEPSILLNLTDGQYLNSSVQLVYTIEDLYLDETVVELNGNSITSGDIISDDGVYDLSFTASDFAGNVTYMDLSFVIDTVSPAITISEPIDGEFYNHGITPIVNASDNNLDSLTATLNGQTYVFGTEIVEDGAYNLTVVATDLSGNVTQQSVSFVIDTQAPSIQISGVENGSFSSTQVALQIIIQDENLLSSSQLLNGLAYESGTYISSNGSYNLVVVAEDSAGNQSQSEITFNIDTLSPQLSINGITNNLHYNVDVSPVLTVDEENLANSSITLNGETFVNGEVVSEEGSYVYIATASDLAGNISTEVVNFTIDKTAPDISVSGVNNGSFYATAVMATILVTDINLGESSSLLNNLAYISGTPIEDEGSYQLLVTGSDLAGNETSVLVNFTVDTQAPVITVTGVENGGVYQQVQPTILATDNSIQSTTILLNGSTFNSGELVDAEGEYLLEVLATDLAGNESSLSMSFSVDTTSPLIQISGVEQGGLYPTSVVVDVSVQDLHEVSTNIELNGALITAPLLISQSGFYELNVFSVDEAGNSTSLGPVQFAIDLDGPAITFVKPQNGEVVLTSSLDITVALQDAVSGVESAEYSLDGVDWLPLVNESSNFYSANVSGLVNGSYTLSVKAIDMLGNQTNASVNFEVLTGGLLAEKDSVIKHGFKNDNEGANESLELSGDKEQSIIIGFNLNEVDVTSVETATLVLTINSEHSTLGWDINGNYVNVHTLYDDYWIEGNGSILGQEPVDVSRGSGEGATWNCAIDINISDDKKECSKEWKHKLNTEQDLVESALHYDHLTGEVHWDVTGDVKRGIGNWLIKREYNFGAVTYYSREGAEAINESGYAPRLDIIYKNTDVCQETPCDTDLDGVSDAFDMCPDTPQGDPVTEDGCNPEEYLGLLCSPPSHGTLMSCVTDAANFLLQQGLISQSEKGSLISGAANTK